MFILRIMRAAFWDFSVQGWVDPMPPGDFGGAFD